MQTSGRKQHWTRLIMAIASLSAFAGGDRADALSRRVMSLEEAVQVSDAVFVGRVVSRHSFWADERKKWMWTDVTLQVEDGIFGVEAGDTVTVRYWGGQIGAESMAINGLAIPRKDSRCVMLLKPESTGPRFSPVVGEIDGLFDVGDGPGGPVVTSAEGGAVTLPLPAAMPDAAMPQPPAGPLRLTDFTTWLRANISSIRARPPLPRPPASLPAPGNYPMRPLTDTPVTPPVRRDRVLPVALSAEQPRTPTPPVGVLRVVQTTPDAPLLPPPRGRSPLYHFLGYSAPLPIVFNQLPPDSNGWAPLDQAEMAKWNYYGDVFRVLPAALPHSAWHDGQSDIVGWIPDEAYQLHFGAPWPSNVYGLAHTDYIGTRIVETDIILNPAWTWTLDEEPVFEGVYPAVPFRTVMLHELGHAWGLDHNFQGLSVMNYVTRDREPLRGVPFMDDTEALRVLYPSAAQERADTAINLFTLGAPDGNGGYGGWWHAQFPFGAEVGRNIYVSGFHLENVGTVTKNVVVDWYLTKERNFGAAYHHLGTVDYGALPRFRSLEPPPTILDVPWEVPAGSYYLSAFIPNDEGAGHGGFIPSNNYAFSKDTIRVDQRLRNISPQSLTLMSGQEATLTVCMGGAVDGLVVLWPDVPASAPLEYPERRPIFSDEACVALPIRALSTTKPVTFPFRVTLGDYTVEATVRVVPPYTVSDVRTALQAASGLRSLTSAERDRLNLERSGASLNAVDMPDVASLLRVVRGVS